MSQKLESFYNGTTFSVGWGNSYVSGSSSFKIIDGEIMVIEEITKYEMDCDGYWYCVITGENYLSLVKAAKKESDGYSRMYTWIAHNYESVKGALINNLDWDEIDGYVIKCINQSDELKLAIGDGRV